jgi:hypothetical protein
MARVFAVLFLVLTVNGCSDLRGFKLWAPERFGLKQAAGNVYIEAGADASAVRELRAAAIRAEREIRAVYTGVGSRPVIHACITEHCYESFGGMGSTAKVYGDRILLSPRGLNWHFLAHEWSHAELNARLTWRGRWQLPAWFTEGLAVAVSAAPEHSEDHWRYLVENDVPRPTRAQLLTYRSGRQWLDATARFGDARYMERRARGEPEIRPVCAAAGHELRPWLAEVGSQGLLDVIERLNGGEDFDAVYRPAKVLRVPGNPPAANLGQLRLRRPLTRGPVAYG